MTILVVEDERSLARSLQQGLRDHGYEALHAGTLGRALDLLASSPLDLVLLDLGLPDGDGLKLLQACRRRDPPCPVIILSARDRIEDRVLGLDTGADDYMVKPFEFGELLARIRVQLRHAGDRREAVLRVGDLTIDLLKREVRRGDDPVDLTPREFDLLACLAEARGEVVSRDRLGKDVWRVQRRSTSLDNVIDVHISRLRERIDKDRGTRLIRTVRGVGFHLKADPS